MTHAIYSWKILDVQPMSAYIFHPKRLLIPTTNINRKQNNGPYLLLAAQMKMCESYGIIQVQAYTIVCT